MKSAWPDPPEGRSRTLGYFPSDINFLHGNDSQGCKIVWITRPLKLFGFAYNFSKKKKETFHLVLLVLIRSLFVTILSHDDSLNVPDPVSEGVQLKKNIMTFKKPNSTNPGRNWARAKGSGAPKIVLNVEHIFIYKRGSSRNFLC